jgi:hypothetical protein
VWSKPWLLHRGRHLLEPLGAKPGLLDGLEPWRLQVHEGQTKRADQDGLARVVLQAALLLGVA